MVSHLPVLQENPDLFKWLTGQLPAPEEVEANSAYRVRLMGF